MLVQLAKIVSVKLTGYIYIFVLFFSHQLSYSSDLSVNAVKVFEVLVNYLVTEHIDYAVELGLLGETVGLSHSHTQTQTSGTHLLML